jgi:hypothetical protein
MKRIITIAAGLLFAAASFAQTSNDNKPAPAQQEVKRNGKPHKTPEERAKQGADEVAKLVTLSPDQYNKVLSVFTDYQKKKTALMGGEKKNEMTDAQRADMKKLNAERRTNLQAALGPDLYKKYEAAKKAEHAEKRDGHEKGEMHHEGEDK